MIVPLALLWIPEIHEALHVIATETPIVCLPYGRFLIWVDKVIYIYHKQIVRLLVLHGSRSIHPTMYNGIVCSFCYVKNIVKTFAFIDFSSISFMTYDTAT